MSNSNSKPCGVLPVMPSADVAASLDFYTNTLGFTELLRQPDESGELINGLVTFAGGQLMFNLNPDPVSQRGGGVYFWFRLPDDQDIDALYEKLTGRGVTVIDEIADQFWGDRSFSIVDHAGFYLAFNKAIAEPRQ